MRSYLRFYKCPQVLADVTWALEMWVFKLTAVNIACNCFWAGSSLEKIKQKTQFRFPHGIRKSLLRMILIWYQLCYKLSLSKTLKLNFLIIFLINLCCRISFYSSFLVLKTRLSKSPFPKWCYCEFRESVHFQGKELNQKMTVYCSKSFM